MGRSDGEGGGLPLTLSLSKGERNNTSPFVLGLSKHGRAVHEPPYGTQTHPHPGAGC